MIKPYVMTAHAKERKQKFFPRVNLVKDLDSVTNCSAEEIYELKSLKAYKEVKASKKSFIRFLKTKANMYLVIDQKVNKDGKKVNFIVTIINLKHPESSFIDSSFKKAAIHSAYELEQINKQLPSENKVINELNKNQSLKDFNFHEKDFVATNSKTLMRHGKDLIAQRSNFLGARAGLVRGFSNGANLQELLMNALHSTKKSCKYGAIDPIKTVHLKKGRSKKWFLDEYAKFVISISEGLKRLISQGKMVKKSDLNIGFNFYNLLLTEKGYSNDFDNALTKFLHYLILSDVVALKQSISKNEDIYSSYLRKTLIFVEELKGTNFTIKDDQINLIIESNKKIQESGLLYLEGSELA